MSPTTAVAGPHLVRYGTAADQRFLLGEFLDGYHELVINANMVAHMPTALASFICQRAGSKPYFIDPQTHAFQHDPRQLESASPGKEGTIKTSISKLLEAYGQPVKNVVGNKHSAVSPQDFANVQIRQAFCKRVIDFQYGVLANKITKSDAAKYYRFLEKKGKMSAKRCHPTLVVAPYFYMTRTSKAWWLPVNVAMLADCRRLKPLAPLAAQVVIEKGILLDDACLTNIVAEYSKAKPDVFLVWVDSFPEEEASSDELRALVHLIQSLGKTAPVVNLYGGFFSITLRSCGVVNELIGIVHGLEYGEARGVVPVGGGIPTAKYYYPELHSRLLFRDAMRAVREVGGLRSPKEFFAKVCACEECRSVIKNNPEHDFSQYGITKQVSFTRKGQPVVVDYPIPETKAHSVKHYMWCKAKEYSTPASKADTLTALKAAARLERALGKAVAGHCGIWHEVLTKPGT